MKICVIGAGPSGLTTIKQLLDQGHSVTCFERDDDIGGIWRRTGGDNTSMRVFDSLVLTVSMKLMAFSDFMHEGERTFTDHHGYLQYLHAYAKKFGLRERIRFRTAVDSVRYEHGSWRVRVTTPQGSELHEFDALAVCTGPFQLPNDKIAELAGYTGPIEHSAYYRNAEAYRGKRVLVVGLAESGADIVREISDVAQSCSLAIRSRTFLLPRLFYGKYATDMMTWRAHHHEEWVRAMNVRAPKGTLWGDHWAVRRVFLAIAAFYGVFVILKTLVAKLLTPRAKITSETLNHLGEPMLPYKMDLGTENNKANIDALNEWNDKSHDGAGNWTQRRIFCKNVTFIPAIVSGKIKLHDCGIASAEGQIVRFKDGSAGEYDIIVLCTGFQRTVPLGAPLGIHNLRELYKLAFHPDYDGRLALIGFVRPYSGGIPVCAEMQARYFASLCSGRIKLPADVRERIVEERAWLVAATRLSPRSQEAIPSQILFMDSMAREIGCLTPTSHLLLRPRLLVKHWFCSFNQACYRLTGPNSDPENARRELLGEKLPAEAIRFVALMTALSFLPHFIHPKNLEITLD